MKGQCWVCGRPATAWRLVVVRARGRKQRPTRLPVCRDCEYNILVLGRTKYERDGEVIEVDVGDEEEAEDQCLDDGR